MPHDYVTMGILPTEVRMALDFQRTKTILEVKKSTLPTQDRVVLLRCRIGATARFFVGAFEIGFLDDLSATSIISRDDKTRIDFSRFGIRTGVRRVVRLEPLIQQARIAQIPMQEDVMVAECFSDRFYRS